MSIGNEILPDNPAARLQSILVRMLEVQYSVNEPISTAFSRMFDANNAPSEILRHYSQLFVLIDDAYNKVVQYYPKQVNTHSAWRAHFTEVFRSNSPYHHQWGNLIIALRNGSHLEIVQIANDNLEHYVKPTKINGLSMTDLEDQVSVLIIDIENSSELSDYLKAFLKEELIKILGYIKNFDLYGSDPIRKSIYNVIGNIEVSKNLTTKAIAGVSALLIAVASSIGIVNDVASTPESIEKLKANFYIPYVEPIFHNSNESDLAPEVLLQTEVEK